MRRVFLTMILGVFQMTSFGQINLQDSSVQVISYWNLGDTYNYEISFQRMKYTETDTISNETLSYEVEVSVIDSSEHSYIIQWFYKNFKSDSENPVEQMIASVAQDIKVKIKLDEFGMILAVENWEEVRDYIVISLSEIKAELNVASEMDNVFRQIEAMYSSKEAIEAASIQDVHQFHTFHGGRYILNEPVTTQNFTPNLFDKDKPFDTQVSIALESLDGENNQCIIRTIQELDSEQLTEATYQYLKKLLPGFEKEFPKRKEFPTVTNTTEIVSRIHGTGWVLESIQWKEVLSENITNMEIRTIVMK